MPVAIPTSLEKALSLLALRPDSVVLAGGTDLMVEVNSGHRQIGSVIAIDRVAELRTWSVDEDRRNLWIGSGVPYSTVMQDGIATLVPALAQASRTVGSPQIRHVGTSLNVGHLMLLLQYGNMSKDTTKYNTRLFAEKVMPKVKDLFGDWEDKWWPKPMAKGQRAAVPAFRPQLTAAE